MNTANSFNLAVCEDLSGYTYYPWLGSYVPQSKSGWQKDAITDGKLTVAYTDSKLDILYLDSTGSIYSAESEGAEIRILMTGSDSFSIMAEYTNMTIDIYSFWRLQNGKFKYSLVQVKGGASPIHKRQSFVGDCSRIDFSWMKLGYKFQAQRRQSLVRGNSFVN